MISDDESLETDDSQSFSLDQILEACTQSGMSVGNALTEIIAVGRATSCGGRLQRTPTSLVDSQLLENATEEECLGKRRKTATKRLKNAKLRMSGEQYVGFRTTQNDGGKRSSVQDASRDAKSIGPPCKSKLCAIRESRHCGSFGKEAREQLFFTFWKQMNWEQKRVYVLSHLDKREPVVRTVAATGDFRKGDTFMYYLKLDGVKKQVCRNLFLSTLGIGRSQLRSWVSNPFRLTKQRKVRDKSTYQGGDAVFATKFIEDLPKMPSHYCRASSSKLYLEPIVRNMNCLYKVYEEKCEEQNVKAVSLVKFTGITNSMNISIFQPKKDMCDICCAHGNQTEEERKLVEGFYQNHIKAKEDARLEKDSDKTLALERKCHTLTMDLQKVLLSPCLNASALYYKTKLTVHNFTVFNLATKHVKCYLWNEVEADLVASVFASCIIKYMDENFKDDLPVIIFSDGCTYQNRNSILSNALSHYATTKKKVITQKFLEKGHTHMEVDSVHAAIERKLKNVPIYHPMDYVNACLEARRNPSKYDVQYMNHKDFLDYFDPKTMRYSSIRPGNKSGDPHMTDLRQIRYNLDGTLDYKLNHSKEWNRMPRRSKTVRKVKFPRMYKSQLPLEKRKYKDLMDLLHVIPEKYHEFYRSLPCKK